MSKFNKVTSSLKNLSTKLAASLKYKQSGEPGKELNLVGIVGAAGKTTTAYYLYNIFRAKKVNVASITSQGSFCAGQQLTTIPVDEFTPEQLFEILQIIQSKKASIIFLEVTPNLIKNKALQDLTLQALILTNLLVKDMEDQLERTRAEHIFSAVHRVKEKGLVVINADEPHTDWLLEQANKVKQYVFAAWCQKKQLNDVKLMPEGTSFSIGNQKFSIPAVGEYNLMNIMLAIRFAVQYVSLEHIAIILGALRPAPARLELVHTAPAILVDSATNSSRIEHALQSARLSMKPEGQLVAVIGAGYTDRAMEIGFLAASIADFIILAPQSTFELTPAELNQLVWSGIERVHGVLVDRFDTIEEYKLIDKAKLVLKANESRQSGRVPVFMFDEPIPESRELAIDLAAQLAKPEDTIVLAGAGDTRELRLGEGSAAWSELRAVQKVLGQASK